MWPDFDKGGPGFYNDPDLVWRGFAVMRSRGDGRRPTKQEIIDLDPDWDHDLTMAGRFVQYCKDIKGNVTDG